MSRRPAPIDTQQGQGQNSSIPTPRRSARLLSQTQGNAGSNPSSPMPGRPAQRGQQLPDLESGTHRPPPISTERDEGSNSTVSTPRQSARLLSRAASNLSSSVLGRSERPPDLESGMTPSTDAQPAASPAASNTNTTGRAFPLTPERSNSSLSPAPNNVVRPVSRTSSNATTVVAPDGGTAEPGSPQEQCSICLESLTRRVQTCQHCHRHFHPDCLDNWLRRNNSCPTWYVFVQFLDLVTDSS